MEEEGEKVMNFTFHNFPRKFEFKDYENTLNYVVKRYASSDLVAIYDWGTPSVPGISDMDILLVWKKDARSLPLMKRTFATLPSRSKYLLYHPVVHIAEEDFENIPYVYPNGTLRKVWGKTLKTKALSAAEQKEASACILNDITVRHYPRDFLQSVAKGKIDVRGSLLRLNSMKYTFSTMRSLGIKTGPRWDGFAKEVEKIRKNWFSDPNEKMLSSLVEEALCISMDIVERCIPFQEKRFAEMAKGTPKAVQFKGIKNATLFINDWEKDQTLKNMMNGVKKGKNMGILPLSYAKQLMAYSQEKGEISEHIRKNVQPLIALKKKASNALQKRIGVLNNQAELASRLKHSDFPAFFDFGYRNQKGINNTILRISDKLRF